MLAREIHHLGDFGLRDLVGEDAAYADAVLMHMQHHPCRVLASHVKDPFKHMNDEFHGRVVVIEQQHLVERGLLGLRLRLGDDARICPATPGRLIRRTRFFWRQS